jgi:Fe-S-cluster-containing dehydrogenase component/CRP-like cAMP-binding protein
MAIDPEELKKLPLFAELPYKFLSWNANAFRRRELKPKDVLFHEGDYASTAFILTKGSLFLEVRSSPWSAQTARSSSMLSRFLGHRALIQASRFGAEKRQGGGQSTTFRSESGGQRTLGVSFPLLKPDLRRIIGEAACLNNYPRADTATAVLPSEVLEFPRNVLLAMLRHEKTRREIRERYRSDSLASFLMGAPLFAGISDDAMRTRVADFFIKRAELLDFKHIHPEQLIYREGDPARHLCLVRVGFVKVASRGTGQEIVHDYVGPGGIFGQLELVAGAAPELADELPSGWSRGTRLNTCTALDTVDIVRIDARIFSELIAEEPDLLHLLVKVCRKQISKYWGAPWPRAALDWYLNDGIQSARQLLAIDLERCTRCDECSKACANSHGGVTRLIREGIRHDKYLVTNSCRSCMNPYCMAGCPVDSIHRGLNREIVIEDHCIGCGSCATHCPYNNIRMVEVKVKRDDPDGAGRKIAVMERKATTCDLCQGFLGEDEKPSCVFACPHDAIERMNGREFLEKLTTAANAAVPKSATRPTTGPTDREPRS